MSPARPSEGARTTAEGEARLVPAVNALPFASAAILGAGLMGRLLALALARAGCRVELFDAGGPQADGAAARVAAAMLAPLAESAVAPPSVVRMGHYALTRWPELLGELAQPVFFQREGTLVLWHRQDAAEAARLARVLACTVEQVPELPAMRTLDAAGIATLEPALGRRFVQGLLLPEEGQLDNRELLSALLATLESLPNVRLHWHAPRSLDDFRPREGERVIDCRGLGAQPQWSALRGVRGEVIRVHAPEVALTRPTRLVHPRYPLYIAPKPNHVFVIGATEIESEDMSPASVRSTLELLSAAYAVHSGFAEARIIEIATQCRPTLPDNLPAFRQPRARVMQINGLYRHGFMIAPAMLDVALELLRDNGSALAERFALATGLESIAP
ncbi:MULTISPECIES: FAD-dependent oxidoreductase [unclassified Variovorax]|uniref:FAD-dependent oxidoreductase n=1 Tax=unclassified Variovorax TaxID=663243 RepID=UPI00076D6206|nr:MULTISPECIES: FAD-dependent oxidoreductase [unclassified Variovorax]KWT89379.1 Glycine oxidase ThiO [Variovorax sp. WDL1]PNG56556.1 tRNA 5-methylaminomethyl-2-thiouridine biosynthesis bifunctional protein MnmC [Variovorax sp. B4]PNG57980.1 tRNA 5-methylaminomethyl-2-thiouridine biosynthesis bifunctional protein MnmC [Variovorax sp. B2]VTV09547.1 bifunctional tRNA (mnm(5)s(2)U34)-methyltransferase/FAD-dependent cmnm(5)s(2)U34 oxidoreductase [Variovorax sp. WDL1]